MISNCEVLLGGGVTFLAKLWKVLNPSRDLHAWAIRSAKDTWLDN
jgi:hypothetical protein